MVQALSSKCPDDPLTNRILPRASWSRRCIFDAEASNVTLEVFTKDRVIITDDIFEQIGTVTSYEARFVKG
jgi:hypothetical protein